MVPEPSKKPTRTEEEILFAEEDSEDDFCSPSNKKKYDHYNISFKDIYLYRLEVNPTDQVASVKNAKFFRDGPKMHPLKDSFAETYFANYKWCKINHVYYYWYGFIVFHNIGYFLGYWLT